MGSKDTVATLFDLAVSVELIAQNLHGKIAQSFSHIPKVSAFFKDLMNDEIKHADALRRIHDSLDPSILVSRADTTMMQKARELVKLSVVQLLDSIETLDDAYNLADELENSEINALFEFLTTAYVPAEDRAGIMRTEIRDHVAKLSVFTERFGDAEWRKRVIAVRSRRVAA